MPPPPGARHARLSLRLCGLRRVRTLLVALCTVGLGFLLAANLMVSRLSPTPHPRDATFPSLPQPHPLLRQLMQPGRGPPGPNPGPLSQGGWGERGPKAASGKTLTLQERASRSFHVGDGNPRAGLSSQNRSKVKDSALDAYGDEKDYKFEANIENIVIKDDDESDGSDGGDDDDNDINHDDDEYYDADGNDRHDANEQPARRLRLPVLRKEKIVLQKDKDYAFEYSDLSNLSIPVENMVQEGIYWSEEVEEILPKGLAEGVVWRWIGAVRSGRVQTLQPPSWHRCGRPKNGFLLMQGGQPLCARYRHPHDHLVLGELLSFHLSRMLGMDSVPAVLLSVVNSSSPQWQLTNPSTLGWQDGQFVALIQWIPNMDTSSSHVHMPELLLKAFEAKSVVDRQALPSNLSAASLSSLVQWGSMLVFDYLTGNYDRVASMQDAAEKEGRPSILRENIRNLRQALPSQKLWLIDNESGLLDAYDLMYGDTTGGSRFVAFHRQTLQTLCLFQRPLVDAIAALHAAPSPHRALEEFARGRDPLFPALFQRVSRRDKAYGLFQTRFAKRLAEVYGWIQFCQSKAR